MARKVRISKRIKQKGWPAMIELKHHELTEKIIAAFYHVYNALGYGFLESVYQKAMLIELQKQNLAVQPHLAVCVYYEGQSVGEFFPDLVVEDLVIVELKGVKVLATEHEAQLLDYLNATRFEVGLLLNFGPKPQIKRKIFDNQMKKYHLLTPAT
jgi:GxxExxY protein